MRKLVWVALAAIVSFGADAYAQCGRTTPALVEPANGATNVAVNTTVKWSGDAGAHDIRFRKQGDVGWNVVTAAAGSSQFGLPTVAGTTYEWYVHPNTCPGGTSPTWTFTTAGATTCPVAAASTPTAPAHNSQLTAGSITFSWTAVTGATGYELWASKDNGTAARLATTTARSESRVLPAGTYSWWIVTLFGAGCPTSESAHAFLTLITNANCPDAAPRILAPVAGLAITDGTPVEVRWSAVANAVSYDVIITTDGRTFNTAANTTGTEASLNGLTVGSYSFAVRVNYAAPCASKLSEVGTFRVLPRPQTTCPAGSVTLISPANNSTNVGSPVTFTWHPVANATRYTLLVSTAGTFENYGSTTGTSLERVVPSGATVRWMVIAGADGCTDVRSTVFQFDSARTTCADATLTLRSPANGATVSSPVTFSWNDVAHTTAYRLWVSIGGNAPEIVSRTTSTEATVNLPSGHGVFYVEALRLNCAAVISERREFDVRAATNCGSNAAPTLIGPNGTTTSPVNFQWNAAAGAIAYRVSLAREGQPSADIALVTGTSLERELPAGNYSWAVTALFSGCPGIKSAEMRFSVAETTPRCSADAPVPLSPAAGSTTTNPVTFSWTAVPGAELYRVLISLDGSPMQQLGATSETTLTKTLPPGALIYTIEAVFDRCPSTFSPRTAFSIVQSVNCTNAAPQLVSPGNNVSGVNAPVTFQWSPVSGAVGYVLFLKYEDGSPTPIRETSATSVTIPQLRGGLWEWFVVAYFAGCRPTTSEHFVFGVTQPESCNNRAPILFEPATGAVVLAGRMDFEWSSVPNATGYRLLAARGTEELAVIATTVEPKASVDVPQGFVRWLVQATFANCAATDSAPAFFIASPEQPQCRSPRQPRANAIGRALSGTQYTLRWTPLPAIRRYEVQESTTADFANPTTQTVEGISAAFTHTVDSQTPYFYRVRGISACSDEIGAYSDVVDVLVVPAKSTDTQRNVSAEVGVRGVVVQRVFVPGEQEAVQFTATVDKPWLRVEPAAGTLPPEGITLNVISDPAALTLGTNTGTVKVTYVTASSTEDGIRTHGTTTKSVPVSVSLVTPVTPVGKSASSPDSLIIPAVARAAGANDSLFESDIRITNLGAQTSKYDIKFTPSGVDGTQTGSTSTIEIAPNETMALDDIMATLFGTGTESVVGMLEIRPLSLGSAGSSVVSGTASGPQTIASSRTYNVTPTGTFGQYIPAIPFSQFAGKGTILSLQQIAQSPSYRTNFGFAEGSGEPAELMVRVYDTKSTLLKEIPVSLKPMEHLQINSMLAVHGITNLQDGRVEVDVLSTTGKVTAYASGVDNQTNDPLLVSPVAKASVSASRYVVPGVALINTGVANWRTDMRVFNAGATDTLATVTFYPQGNPAGAVAKELTLKAGEISVLDNVLSTFFAQANGAGGSIAVATPSNTSVITTARTYNQTATGTYGQFIQGVTPAESVGAGERSLQILQLEHSSRFRTNIGLAETKGGPVKVEVSVILPDTKATPVQTYDLAPNEFRQVSLGDFGLGDSVYNARVTVKVIDGSGRVTAYGSAIDQLTQDPTYVQAQ